MYLDAYMYLHVCMCKCVHMCACGGQKILSILVLETGSLIGLGTVAVTDITSRADHNAQLFTCVHPCHVGITSTCHHP